MHKRTMQEVADFFDVTVGWNGHRALFRLDQHTVTTDINRVVEPLDTPYAEEFAPQKESDV